jgi:hypothetical protein
MLITIVEMPEFVRRARALMTEDDRMELISLLAADPEAGVALGGGLRKVRFARAGSGKSGGFRTIHFYRSGAAPLFLLTVFAKNEKANLSAGELDTLMKLGDQIAAYYGNRT